MGSFYTNVTVLTEDQEAVVSALRSAGRAAYVTPAKSGAVVVYDEACESQDPEELESLCKTLSDVLGAVALGVLNHDDGVLMYWVVDRGRTVDQYNSCPGYFGDGSEFPEGGDAQLLSELFGSGGATLRIERVLREPEEYVFESERHSALIEALGLPSAAVHTGFTYIEQDEGPDGFEIDDLTRVG